MTLCFIRVLMNAELRENGYIAAKGLLEPALASVIYKILLLKQWRGECFRDNHIPTAASVSNAAETDALLLELRPKIEAISGVLLVPTYLPIGLCAGLAMLVSVTAVVSARRLLRTAP